jgi:hypothetical protein
MQGLLCFHMNLKIVFSNSVKNVIVLLVRTPLNVYPFLF